MANTATLATMRDRAKRRGDFENSNYLSDPEWADLLSLGMSELWDLLVSRHEDYFSSTQAVTLVAGTSSYALQGDFMKLLQVDLVDGDDRYTLRRYMHGERNRFTGMTPYARVQQDYEYRLTGMNIEFMPTPTVAGSVSVRYVPQYARFAGDSTLVHAAIPEGWEEYAVLWAVIRALQKEEADTSMQAQLLADLRGRIERTAMERDTNAPARVVDAYGRFDNSRGWY